jgi:predicted nuclease of restriction endonuclease-like (RecB) superfamily
MTEITTTKDYMMMFNDIKKDIQTSRVRAALSVNKELTMLYWRIGKSILEKQQELGWGSKVIEQLSEDLKHTFPDMKGFSIRNLKYMQAFCLAYMVESDFKQEVPAQIVQQLVAQIPWGHNQVILDKLKEHELRKWYIEKTIENGWSRNVLVMQIESGAHLRLGKAQTNFKDTLPKTSSDLAQQLIKNEYNLDFLGLGDDALEKDIEKGLMTHIQKFLLEIGTGFAFLGSQYKLNVGGDDFYIDMLFYHTRLRCYFVIELKAGKFQPEYTGKLGFYVTAVNRQLKHESDQPTIGILLCKQANKLVVEYALQENNQPMGVASYTSGLPDEYQTLIPSQEQFQHLLDTLPEDEKDII